MSTPGTEPRERDVQMVMDALNLPADQRELVRRCLALTLYHGAQSSGAADEGADMRDAIMNLPAAVPDEISARADGAYRIGYTLGHRAARHAAADLVAAQRARTEAGALAAVRKAVTGYYLALDRREHGGAAEHKAFEAIEQALGMHWVQGAAMQAARAPEARQAALDRMAENARELGLDDYDA